MVEYKTGPGDRRLRADGDQRRDSGARCRSLSRRASTFRTVSISCSCSGRFPSFLRTGWASTAATSGRTSAGSRSGSAAVRHAPRSPCWPSRLRSASGTRSRDASGRTRSRSTIRRRDSRSSGEGSSRPGAKVRGEGEEPGGPRGLRVSRVAPGLAALSAEEAAPPDRGGSESPLRLPGQHLPEPVRAGLRRRALRRARVGPHRDTFGRKLSGRRPDVTRRGSAGEPGVGHRPHGASFPHTVRRRW